MRMKDLLIRILYTNSGDAETSGHQLALKGGYIYQTGAGIYTISPLGLKVLTNIANVVRLEMEKIGCQEILMPIVSPASLWLESERYNSIDTLLKFKTKSGADAVLNPTHEEIVCDYVRSFLRSYRQLPFTLYQIQTKYRDELRVRAGLIRCREFIMKDAYSFHRSYEDLEDFYGKMLIAYHTVYRKIGLLGVIAVAGSMGDMGGRMSHEFQIISSVGEDTLYLCDSCDYGCNREAMANSNDSTSCPKCSGKLASFRGIEVGNIFQLGYKYTKSMNVLYNDETGTRLNPTMGCYGIGISRVMACIMEQTDVDSGKFWNMAVTPYRLHIITVGNSEEVKIASEDLYRDMQSRGVETIIDDSTDRIGSKLINAKLIGAPLLAIVSDKNISAGIVEMKYGNVDGSYPASIPLHGAADGIDKIIANELTLLGF
ncbi:MAG: proline--tRNA ligase [Rickettsiales bacterium]|jgi:prolyl-tRNA synthetase|nr:proline--tRNA ligase [Rickettsiales bacterium]